jgi:predicted SprT family Zn-dependent metalloprotease
MDQFERDAAEALVDVADFNPFESAAEPTDSARVTGEQPATLDAPSVNETSIDAGPPATIPTRETYSELQQAYDFFNTALFDDALPRCLITLQREKRSFGYFQDTTFVRRTGETTDEIAMNPRYFATRPIRATLSTLVHEMVHLWQFHFGADKSRKGYHNKEWGVRMERVGLMPSNTGQPGGKKVGEKMSHYIIAGGAFDTACSELLTTQFNLSWMDRHPAIIDQSPVPPETAAAAGMQLPGPEEVAEVEAAGKFVASVATEGEGKKRRTDGSNRVKYRCPSCQTQVWGKPALMILCGVVKCGGTKFEPVATTELTPSFAPSPRPF